MSAIIAKIKGEGNLQSAFAEMFHVLVNLRVRTRNWESVYGSESKNAKKRWEQKADDLIEELQKGKYKVKSTVNGQAEHTRVELKMQK